MTDLLFPDSIELSDAEDLSKRIDDAFEVQQMMETEGWKIVSQKCSDLASQAKRLLTDIDPTRSLEIAKLQVIYKLYSDVLGNIAENILQEGKLCLQEMQLRNER